MFLIYRDGGVARSVIICCVLSVRHNRLQIEESSKPARLSQQLQNPVTNYKPVANHSYNVRTPLRTRWCLGSGPGLYCLLAFLPQLEYEKKKKEEGKRARADKQQVLDMLFSAFEKHQYYNIKDLVDITKQPVVRPLGSISTLTKNKTKLLLERFSHPFSQIYLKEILRDIGNYNVKGTHKNTWELKPEYRHYQGEEKSDE